MMSKRYLFIYLFSSSFLYSFFFFFVSVVFLCASRGALQLETVVIREKPLPGSNCGRQQLCGGFFFRLLSLVCSSVPTIFFCACLFAYLDSKILDRSINNNKRHMYNMLLLREINPAARESSPAHSTGCCLLLLLLFYPLLFFFHPLSIMYVSLAALVLEDA